MTNDVCALLYIKLTFIIPLSTDDMYLGEEREMSVFSTIYIYIDICFFILKRDTAILQILICLVQESIKQRNKVENFQRQEMQIYMNNQEGLCAFADSGSMSRDRRCFYAGEYAPNIYS